jgi:drug/metabolite transporter (DMT)-like permease
MHTTSLYLVTVLIWGSTWFAIKFQLGVVEAEVSLIYRFALAAAILILYCLWRDRSLRFSPTQHMFMALQGLFLFSTNYLIFYWATGLLTSGLVALLFSTVILMNIVNGALFLRNKVSNMVLLGAFFGIGGITGIFWSEVAGVGNHTDSWSGLWMCLIATYVASIGNILSARNQREGLPVVQTNAWGMTYGSIFMVVYALSQGSVFNYDPAPGYSLSLIYLSLFGSIFAFGSYLTLIGRIGADKSAYTAVLFPVIALLLSTLFEDYRWSLAAVFGFGLVLIGNYLVLKKPAKIN